MSPTQETAVSLTKRLLPLLILILVAFLIKGRLVPSIAQTPEEQSPKETVLEETIPEHVPIRIKIKKEKEAAFKDLKNERWARDFELEVTNTGVKPIYSLSLLLVTDLRAAAGFRIVAPLHFGMLGEVTDKAGPGDIPIEPGETYVFKIHPGQLNAWDTIQRKEKRPHPKTIQIKLEVLSFGDGTGLVGNDGEVIPHAPYKQSGLNSCVGQPNQSGSLVGSWNAAPPGNDSELTSSDSSPASFLPVNFLVRPSAISKPIALPDACCSGNGCLPVRVNQDRVCVNCPVQNRITATNCSDPGGSCRQPIYGYLECETGSGQPYACQTIDLPSCGGGPTPTPTPTPTPLPTPAPCPQTLPQYCPKGPPADPCTWPPPPGSPPGPRMAANPFFIAKTSVV